MQSSKRILWALLLAPVVSAAQAPQAPAAGQTAPTMSAQQAAPAMPMAPSHAMTVEALLVLDSQIAMEKMNAQAAKVAPPPPVASSLAAAAAAPPPEKIEVVSILGIGGDKKATLLINGKRYSQLVEGSKAGKYMVQAVGSGCVSLAVQAPKAKGKPGKVSPKAKAKNVCFDPDADDEMLGSTGMAQGQNGGANINTRMTIAPLPLPVVPAPMAVRVNPQ